MKKLQLRSAPDFFFVFIVIVLGSRKSEFGMQTMLGIEKPRVSLDIAMWWSFIKGKHVDTTTCKQGRPKSCSSPNFHYACA